MRRLYLTAIASWLPMLAMAANPQLGFSELAANQAQPHVTINTADRSLSSAIAGQITIDYPSNANYTMLANQWQYGTIRLTDSSNLLTTGRDLIYPNVDAQTGGISRMSFLVVNATAHTITVKRSGQTGIAVGAGSAKLLHHNGTDIESVSAGGGGLTSPVGLADGGTGLTSASDDTTIVSNGSAWQAKALPNCPDTGGNHVNYDPSTNAFSCGTSGTGTPGGSSTQVQYNSSGSFAGDADWTWNATTNTMQIGTAATPALIEGQTPGSTAIGPPLTVRGGRGLGGQKGGAAILAGGLGSASGFGAGGDVYIQSGYGNGDPGVIRFIIGNTSPGSEKFRISTFEDWLLNGSAGSSGNVIKSNGINTYPTWGALSLSNANSVTGTLPQANRLAATRTVTAAGAITVTSADEIICVNKTSGAATAVNLHSGPTTGFRLTVKDCKGDAATNLITVTPSSGNIDGSANAQIITNYGWWIGFYDGTQWYTIGKQ